MFRAAMAPPPRTRREFLEQDVWIPDGPYKGEQFRYDRLPFTRLLVDAMDSALWAETFVTGPSQSGKTLIAHVVPPIYVAAELRRNLVIAMPDMRMVSNKWLVDFEPVFRASPKLRQLLPTSGPGSQGGTVKDTVRLANGVVIKFMTAGGDDVARAGFTAEGGVFVTEAARFSHASEVSVEADPLDQLRARMQSLARRDRRLTVEGTVTTELELPWSAREHSTQSTIVTPCPHCRAWISPERDNLTGWEEAESDLEAAEEAWWFCPSCGEQITEEERRDSNQQCQLLHAGQSIDKRGRITGEPPRTERLFFRWSAWHNLLLTAADIAPDEWKASRLEEHSEARELAEKKLCQFVWCMPWSPPDIAVQALQVGDVSRRASELTKGELPDDTEWLTIGVDCGMYWIHWVAIAWRASRCAHVAEYEAIPVLARGEGESAVERQDAVKVRLWESLDALHKRCLLGWTGGSKRRGPDRVLVDAGWLSQVIHAWCRQRGQPYFPSYGRGTGQRSGHVYSHPHKRTSEIRYVGEQYHLRRHREYRTLDYWMDSDYWKNELHRMLPVTPEQPGSLTLFRDVQTQHKTFERHLLAERLVKKVDPRHGPVEVFENPEGKANHFFDASYAACVGGHHAGFRLVAGGETAARGGPQSGTWLNRTGGGR